MNCISPPPLDPARARHIEAFDALIDRRLRSVSGRQYTLAARQLLKCFHEDGLATFTTNPLTGATGMTMLGVTSAATEFDPPAILRLWQHAARDRLAMHTVREAH